MIGPVCVFGLWHLGCVTAACLAAEGVGVVGLDPDCDVVARLQSGTAPIAEPGLDDLLASGLRASRLRFTADADDALREAEVVWVTFDTPVDNLDRADVGSVRSQLEAIRDRIAPRSLILVSSQVPVGFTGRLEREWRSRNLELQFAVSPENLRLGSAIDAFRNPGRVVVGVGQGVDRDRLRRLFRPFTTRIEWMSLESAEMTKHALNGFLAVSATFANELARICERVGADALDVERGIRSDPRVGPRAYVSPGPPIAGGTLMRDVNLLRDLAADRAVATPILEAIHASNEQQRRWVRERVLECTAGRKRPVVALLGLTYKPGTDTLRRSAAVELARWLIARGIRVQAYDPAISVVPPDLKRMELASSAVDALRGAAVAVVMTRWPEFRHLGPDQFTDLMKTAAVVDESGFLAHLGDDPRIRYVRLGLPKSTAPFTS